MEISPTTTALSTEVAPELQEPRIFRDLVTQIGTKAANLYTSTRDSSPMLRGGLGDIEERLSILRQPIIAHWNYYGDPLITRADQTLSKALLAPTRTVVRKMSNLKMENPVGTIVKNAQNASFEMLWGRNNQIQAVQDDAQHDSFVSRESDFNPDSSSSYFLNNLRDRLWKTILSYQRAVQISTYSKASRCSLMGTITEYYCCALKLIESHSQRTTGLLTGTLSHLSIVPSTLCSRLFVGPIKEYLQSSSPSPQSLVAAVEYLLFQLKNFLGLSKNENEYVASPPSSPIECNISSENDLQNPFGSKQSSPTKFNPQAPEFVPSGSIQENPKKQANKKSETKEPKKHSPSASISSNSSSKNSATGEKVKGNQISVLGLETAGLNEQDAHICLLAVKTLEEMLREKKGSPLKQPGLSRKLYAKDPLFQQSIESAGGLRAFVKRFHKTFRIFPGKGTVWFVTLKENENEFGKEKNIEIEKVEGNEGQDGLDGEEGHEETDEVQ
eukprot:c20034_g1_i1.p1 GENE.c20034_g1_i1~~c20034_g1_i1.p1  ORF type:complete len:500 (-),score=221.33 c20034_g1_i1:89-1588(-)